MAGGNVDFYFAYEIMSQMVALYGVAFRAQDDAADTLQSLVADMGTAFKLADGAASDGKKAATASASSWINLTERLRRIQPRLNQWTGKRRWLRVLRACETCWQAALDDMTKDVAGKTDVLAELAETSRERVAFLLGRDAHMRDLHRRRNDSYAVPVPL